MIYLHHYPASLFSEKVRLMLGYLDLTWHSVEIPAIMPRPLLMPLSGGYRRTPVLQIGANVYCDTQIICKGLARLSGNTTLYAPGIAAQRMADWVDTTLFRTSVALNFRPEALMVMMSQFSEEEAAAFAKDRAELAPDTPLAAIPAEAAQATMDQVLTEMEASLGSDFIFADAPSIADFSLYHVLWFLKNNPVNAGVCDPYPKVSAWYARMAAFGHGNVSESTGEAAQESARDHEPELPALTPALGAADGLPALASPVTVTPTDYGCIPVAGLLRGISADEIVIERETPESGVIYNHFPQSGFVLATDG